MIHATVLLLQKGVMYSEVCDNTYACDNFSQLLPNFKTYYSISTVEPHLIFLDINIDDPTLINNTFTFPTF
jgi:hypothetical protein